MTPIRPEGPDGAEGAVSTDGSNGTNGSDSAGSLNTTVVAAVARTGVIGADGDLVWRNSEDLRRLKAMTMGHTLVMGRRNFDSIGRALPGRRTVVLTRQEDWQADGVSVVHDAEEELRAVLLDIVHATHDPEIFIFGGGDIYQQLMPRAGALEITEIDAALDGDVYFPDIDPRTWHEVARDEQDGFAWVRYERLGAIRALGCDTGAQIRHARLKTPRA